MSTMIALKEAGVVVLATDSRFMNNDFSHVDNDAAQKITQIGNRDAFIATSGWGVACEFHAEGACEIAERLNTDDIVVISSELHRHSDRILLKLVERLSRFDHDAARRAVTGQCPLQGFVMAGRGAGSLGYVMYVYWYRDGQLKYEKFEHFGSDRRLNATGILPEVYASFAEEPATFRDSPLVVVKRLLSEARRTNPYIGGHDQIVLVDHEGARWISRPPAWRNAQGELCHATITAAISITAPTLTGTSVVSGGLDVRSTIPGAVWPRVQVFADGIRLYSSSGGAAIALEPDAGWVSLSVPLYISGQKVLGARGASVSDPVGGAVVDAQCRAALSDLLSRLRASTGHGLIGG